MESNKVTNNEIWYEMWTPASARPFYVKKKGEIVSWDVPADAIIYDPPDGYFSFPPSPALNESDNPLLYANNNESETRAGSILSTKTDNGFQQDLSQKHPSILALPIQHPEELMDIPYFPDDLFVLMSKTAIYEFLQENLLDQYTGTIKKVKMPLDSVIRPGKKSLSGQLYKKHTTLSKSIYQSLFKAIHSYITSNSESSLTEFTKLIEGNKEFLADEAAVQLLTEANSTLTTSTVINAWNMLLYLGAVFVVTENVRKLVRSFSFLTACSEGVDPELKGLSTLCLLRFSSRNPITYSADLPLSEVMKQCTSMTSLFNFSLNEILWKEELRGIEHRTNCVPQLLKKIAIRLKDLGAYSHEGVFRKPGSRSEQISISNRVNSGDWEIDTNNCDTAASLIYFFFTHLRDSVIPPDIVLKTKVDAPSYVSIANANSLATENRDTLMYFIGMLQEYLKYKDKTLMTTKNFVISFGTMLSKIPDPKTLEELKSFPPTLALNRMFSNLIRFWRTSDVFTPLNDK